MNSESSFLCEKIANNDLLLVKIRSAPRPQVLHATVEEIYSTGKGITASCLGKEIEFTCSPGTWGQVPLRVDDKALLFIRSISHKLYEDSWRGHMLIEDIDGKAHAIFNHKELWLSDNVPEKIKANARQDPKRPNATAILFSVMEQYLKELIDEFREHE